MNKDAGVTLMYGGSRSSDEVGHGNEKKRKLPFDCEVLEQPEVIKNPFSGESVELPPDAVAVYDCIKGAEALGETEHLRKGLDWFIKNEPDAYMKLLD
jgi:hypothetical protein|tara:strand:+ start:229 stop:522 length:294 start_codon:yes stop_codon:yes gene_type:complete